MKYFAKYFRMEPMETWETTLVISILILIAVGLATMLVWLRLSKKNIEKPFDAKLINDIAEMLSNKKEIALQGQDLKEAIKNLLYGEGSNPNITRHVKRIEQTFTKTTPSLITVKKVIHFDTGTTSSIITHESETPWENLPSKVRKEFIMTNANPLVFLIYDSTKR